MFGIAISPLIVALSAFAAVFCIVWACITMYRDYAARQSIVEKVRSASAGDSLWPETPSLDSRQSEGSILMSLLRKIGNRYAAEGSLKYSVSRVQFLQAGIHNRMAVPVFWGMKIILMALLPLCFFTFRVASIGLFHGFVVTVFIAAALGLAGLYIPNIWLSWMISSRKNRISRSLPDALDMLVVCVESGLGLDAAIKKVSEEIRLTAPDLSHELGLYNLEMRAGTSRVNALNNLNRRTDLDEVQSLTSLLIQTDRFGTSLAQGLRVYAESFRTKRFMRAEERAAKLPTKLMLPVLFFIFPALFVVIALPAAIRLYYAFIAPGQ